MRLKWIAWHLRGRVVRLLQHVCWIGSTSTPPSCTLSQWQVLSTQLQQAAARSSRWRCVCRSQPGVASRSRKVDNAARITPKWPGKHHQISRRSPFWCSQICCTWFLFFMNGSMSSKDILLFDRAEHASPPKQDSWCCGSPHGGRTETRLPVSGGSQNRPLPENAQILSATHHDPSSCAISKRSRKEQVPASHA